MVSKRLGALSGALALACVALAPESATAQVVPTLNANQFGPQMIGAPAAWARGYNGAGVVVVVADTGIDPNHPAFAGKIDLGKSRSFVLASAGAAYDAANITDLAAQSHGTHVAGIVAASATSNSPGIGFGAGLIVLKMLSPCKTCGAPGINAGVAALDYYAGLDNVFIYNGSYGPDAPANSIVWPASEIDPGEADSARAVLAKGKLLVMANGNDGLKSPIASANPSGLALAPFLNPANANANVYADGNNNFNFSFLLDQPGMIIAVAAVGQAKVVAGYSQKCGVAASWCVSAPGGDTPTDIGIWSTFPNNQYGAIDGTSMATPAVSGALAVLAQAYPGYAPRDWATVLFATAENIGTQAGVNATSGYGLIRLDRAIDGPTFLASGTVVDVGAQQMTYWSQPLALAGGVTKAGAGYLTIAGRTTAPGDVTVNAGALNVGGTLTLQTQMIVAQGASLTGFGRIIGGTTVINGTLDPGQLPNYADLKANNGGNIPAGIPLSGTSIGTLTFQGNVTLAATATMIEGIDGALVIPGGPRTFDKTIVTGAGATFTVGGTLAPDLRNIVGGTNTYTPPAGTAFQIVSAQNGATIAGNFANITQPVAGLAANTRLDVVYATTSITLNVTPTNFQALQQRDNGNLNQQAVAQALDTVRPQPGARTRGAATDVFDDLYDNTAAQDDAEFEQLSGEGQAANPGAALTAFSGLADQIADRQTVTLPNLALASLDDPAAPAPAMLKTASGWQAWGQGFGRWSNVDAGAGLPGSKTAASGFNLGLDAVFGADLRAGVAFGFVQTETLAAGESAATNTYAAAAYGTWTPGAWVIDGRFAIGPSATDSRRFVTLLGVPTPVTGSYSGLGYLVSADVGYRTEWQAITVKPYVGLTVQGLDQGDFIETSAVGLSFPSQTFTKVTSELGVRATSEFELAGLTLEPDLKAAWAHELSDNSLVTHAALFGAPFEIHAAEPGEDAFLVDGGVSVLLSDRLAAFVGYAGEFRSNATSQEVRGGLRLDL